MKQAELTLSQKDLNRLFDDMWQARQKSETLDTHREEMLVKVYNEILKFKEER